MGTQDDTSDPLNHARRVTRASHVESPPPPRKTKVSYWDRPAPVRDWHWFLGRLGSTLIVSGLLVFLFVGYQLWGTGIEAAQSQDRLESTFIDIAQPPPSTSDQGSVPPAETTRPIVVANGDPVAIIEIPTIGVSKYVVAGVDTADLKKGPGHYPNTPMPGELGNVAIAGHRTTYGEPFRRLDELTVGDPIILTDLLGRAFTYRVTKQTIVSPQDSWVVDTVDPTRATLTLTTCHPEFSARQRLVVMADLDTRTSPVASSPAADYTSGNTTAGDATTTEPAADVADVFDRGWFSDTAAFPQLAAWVAFEVVVLVGAWLIAKRLRNRAIGVAVGVIPFFVVLYFVFQNVNRLLPPNL